MDGTLWLNFRENMRYFRLSQGITGKQMAARMGKSVSWVSQTETGFYAQWPTPETMQAISQVLGVSIKQMVAPLPPGIVLNISPMESSRGISNLEKIRKHRKLSKRQFSDKLGISRSAYSSVSNGYHDFSIENWWQIARALNMDLRILIGRD